MQQQIQFQSYKLGTVCSHGPAKTSSNHVDISCIRHPQIYHRVSQASKICNKCATLIMRSVNSMEDCPCCSDTLQSLMTNAWICTHKNRNLDEITIKCLNNEKQTHDVPFRYKVCKICYQKIRASFMFASSCAVCDQKESEIFQNLEKTITKPSFYFFDQIIKQMRDKKFKQEEMKAEIQHYCLADPQVQCASKFEKQSKQFGENQLEYHQSKRYQLYPKCPKHRANWISLCNNCIVSILNLKCCPYGCVYEKRQSKATKAEVINQTGFLCMYPKQVKESQYLQLFTIRNIEEANQFDKWEGSLKKIKYLGKQNLTNKFALYAACTQVNKKSIFYCGGVLGTTMEQMKTVGTSRLIIMEENNKSFNIQDLPDLQQPRTGHSLVYLNQRVFVIGGYNKQKSKFLSSCQKFDMKSMKWVKMSNLQVQRSKATAFAYQGSIFAVGGVSNNEQIWNAQCEKYDIQKDEWQKIIYSGFDVPFLTSATSLSNCWGWQKAQNTLIFGGSNYQASTNFVQELKLKDNQFGLKCLQMLNFNRESAALSLMKTDSESQKIAVIFGGVQQHESLLSFDAVRLKLIKDQVSPVFVYDNIQIGSYRLLLRENALSTYSYMKDKLLEQGLLTKQKLQGQEDILKSESKLHLIEKMWYGVGKCFVGYNCEG